MLSWDGIVLAQSMAIVRFVRYLTWPFLLAQTFLFVFHSAACHSTTQRDSHSLKISLIVDDSQYRRFVARRGGLAGKTDLEFVQADMVSCLFYWVSDDLLVFITIWLNQVVSSVEYQTIFWFYSDLIIRWRATMKRLGQRCVRWFLHQARMSERLWYKQQIKFSFPHLILLPG